MKASTEKYKSTGALLIAALAVSWSFAVQAVTLECRSESVTPGKDAAKAKQPHKPVGQKFDLQVGLQQAENLPVEVVDRGREEQEPADDPAVVAAGGGDGRRGGGGDGCSHGLRGRGGEGRAVNFTRSRAVLKHNARPP